MTLHESFFCVHKIPIMAISGGGVHCNQFHNKVLGEKFELMCHRGRKTGELCHNYDILFNGKPNH
jgi:hypothetical protein